MSAMLASLRIITNHGSLATSMASRRLASTRTIEPLRLQDNSSIQVSHNLSQTKNIYYTLPNSYQNTGLTKLHVRQYVTSCNTRQNITGSNPTARVPKLNNSIRMMSNSQSADHESMPSFVDVLDREIQDETAQLSQHLSSDQFPDFSIETDGADVKLTKQVGKASVTVRFTVSSSLACPGNQEEQENQQQEDEGNDMQLVSMPEFQVQITKGNKTLELSCYFDDLESGNGDMSQGPLFMIDEMVMYEGEPTETEFAVSAEYFQDDFHSGILQYLAEHGIDEKFSSNLVEFATNYEKKQYISLMKKLKSFVSS